MNISELIAELAIIQAEHGDIDVFIRQDGDSRSVEINRVTLNTTDQDTTVFIHID